jgi:hypothetical protein
MNLNQNLANAELGWQFDRVNHQRLALGQQNRSLGGCGAFQRHSK